ncbi:UDP-N-acetylmuramyl pentapeptide phosphotransferase/UDP-N-acetylglucosamine-1-phosphate transferase [Beggiatoa alba B18LD]|uniref:UDP-N-acetylmuramyl pentapeptide phosphotransferase/UDP-N-acetylglucosamine-1-phosphate transferase n=1 Tax=Beggiatoa alba B18LD TaxID=395493 RepID=I3CKZ8_9GAMM|nr:glycosyltransferase family 4 protein [Beggiatoa alba]EIJ44291.1 UDP-N-acetylmuramyl pentapeptide phosphotransferase/UDP-N-acetylglucosamine-1-phosphate transferase [Beggiatoa alba B18LD]
MVLVLMLFAFFIALGLTRQFTRPDAFLYVVNIPNQRSLHTRPTPITGGVAFLSGFAGAMFLMYFFYMEIQSHLLWIYLGALLIALISFLDDCYELSALKRLIIHIIATLLLLSQGGYWLTHLLLPNIAWLLPEGLQIVLSLFFVVWMINLYNFMDGMDGFAGGMAIIGFGTFAILGGLKGDMVFMLVNLLLISAVAGFLVFNFPPAKIFMGDTGSSTLGFLAAALSLWGQRYGIFPLWIAVLIFSPFIVDATVTLFKRLLRGEKIWQAHKTHYYQRLVQLGWGHRRTVLVEYGLMCACSLSALSALYFSPITQWILIIMWIVSYVGLMLAVSQLEASIKVVN